MPDNSILNSVKTTIGLEEDYTPFDDSLILIINSVLLTLQQLGVGPKEGYRITGYSETWDDYIGTVYYKGMVEHYVGMKVRYLFDPPQSSAVITILDNEIKQAEWRILAAVEDHLLFPNEETESN